MSTGKVLNHGVSGYATTGIPGDFDDQSRGVPFLAQPNDKILSYANAQSHIGIPMSNFNEPWSGGVLETQNMSAQPYRKAIFGEPVPEPFLPNVANVKIAPINYPDHVGQTYPQQLPIARIHTDHILPQVDRQNNGFEVGQQTGVVPNPIMPQANINVQPNSAFFQGASAATGTHPNNDIANQQTVPNTTRPDMRGGQTPYQKLPTGITIGTMQPQEAPPLYALAPPPDPQVLPGEGTAPLKPTNPAWW